MDVSEINAMKPVPPTLRMKKRYLAFRICCDEKVSKGEFIAALNQESLKFFGELLSSEFRLWLMDFDETNQKGFLVLNRGYISEVISSLTLISQLKGQKASIHVLGISGTIKNLKRKFLKDNTE